jgi:LysR family transcriptional regulator, transcriptional activator of the cysJI operon
MHVENLKIFCDLVESRSFSRAAKINDITQSAVSQQLRAMEKSFNVVIMDRSQKQFHLTVEGQKLYDGAKDLLHRYEKLVSELQEMRKIISGSIHISTVYSIGLHELPPYIKNFMTEYPSVNVRVEYRRSNLVYEDVLSNAVDMGLVAYPQKSRQLEIIPFLEDKLVLIVHESHPLASRKSVAIEDLKDEKFIGFDQDIPTRKATDQVFRAAKMDIEPVMEFDNIETVKRAVEINAGIAIVPSTTIENEVARGVIKAIQIRGRQILRPLAIIHRKSRVVTPAMRKFIGTLTGVPYCDADASDAAIADNESGDGTADNSDSNN